MTRHTLARALLAVSLITLTAGAAARYRTADRAAPAYRFVVAPGEDPARLQLRIPAARLVEVDRAGDLIVHADGTERRGRPRAYQQIAGARHDVNIRLLMRQDGNVGFAIGAYDRTQPLTIEPER